MIAAMETEIFLQKNYVDQEPVETIYFGGGTPSLLPARDIENLLRKISETFRVTEQAEITLEANPDDLSPEHLRALRSLGINRLSIGIQSFDDTILTFLNRSHSRATALRAVEDARQAGFNNISIDLIFAIQGQGLDDWEKNIGTALSLRPEHVSAYTLTIEDKTVFGRWMNQGKIAPVPDEAAATQLELLMDNMQAAGYEQYEISNFAKPGFYSRHNSSYWAGKRYLGIGPGAHSYNHHSRQFNIRNNHAYVKALRSGTIPFETEILTRENKINEFILTALRTSTGCNLVLAKALFETDILEANHNYIQTLIANNLAILKPPFLTLTRSGKLLADKIASDLFLQGDR